MVLSVSKLVFLMCSQQHWAQLSLVALIMLLSALYTPAPVQTTFVVSETAAKPQVQKSVVVATVAEAPVPKAASAKVAAPQNCIPTPTHSLPTPLNLSAQADGLTQVKDATAYYQIYGHTATQIQTQLKQCSPNRSGFTAETGYNLTWQYSSTSIGNGLCTLASVKVGLHINTILPQWTPTASAASSLVNSWQNFSSNLAVHENGHALLDQQHAARLLHDLQTLPATDCGSIMAVATAKAVAVVAELHAANTTYDDHTDHGASQGAAVAKL